MTTTVYLYSTYCIEEATRVQVWGTEPPTICPNNHADRTIDTSSTAIIQTVAPSTVTVNEPSDGYFQTKTNLLNIPAGLPGSITTYDISWPIDILLWRSMWTALAENIGDKFDVVASPDKSGGVITANASIGQSTISVMSILSQSLVKGFDLTLDDGVNKESLGMIVEIDKVNNILTLEKSLTFNFAAGTPIKLNLKICDGLYIREAGQKISIGDKGFKGKQLLANTILRVVYTNVDGGAKSMDWRSEYYLNYV